MIGISREWGDFQRLKKKTWRLPGISTEVGGLQKKIPPRGRYGYFMELDQKNMLVPNHYTAYMYLWCVYVNKHVLNILEILADIRVLRLVKWHNRQANDNGFLFHEIGVPEIKLHSTC